MRRFSCTSFNVLLGGLFLMCLFAPSLVRANLLTMEVAVGFDGRLRLGTWTPVRVTLENRLRPTRGTLEVIVTSGSEYRADIHRVPYRTDVELPLHSRKRFSFTVLIHTVTHDLTVRFREDKKVLIEQTVNLRPYPVEKELAVLLDPLDGTGRLPGNLFSVHIRAESLPDAWYGYDAVNMLLTRSDTLQGLREKQFEALETWIRRGGCLVLWCGVNLGSLAEKRITRLFPMTVRGLKPLRAADALEALSQPAPIDGAPVLVLDGVPEKAQTLIEAAGIPLVSRQPLGAGQILFLAFDLQAAPFSRLDEEGLFWEKILSPPPPREREPLPMENPWMLDALLAAIPGRLPDFRWMLFLAGFYFSLAVFFFKRLETRRDSRPTYLLGLGAVILCFAVAGSRIFFDDSQKTGFAYRSFLRLHLSGEDGPAAGDYVLGLFATKDTRYRIRFKSAADPVTHLLAPNPGIKIPGPYALIQTDGELRVEGFLRKWSHQFFTLRTTVPFPVTAEAVQGNDHLKLAVHNRSAHDLSESLVFFDNRVSTVKTLLPGERATLRFDIPRRGADRLKVPAARLPSGESGSRIPAEALAKWFQHSRGADPNRLHLIGWLPAEILAPDLDTSVATGGGATLLYLDVPVRGLR